MRVKRDGEAPSESRGRHFAAGRVELSPKRPLGASLGGSHSHSGGLRRPALSFGASPLGDRPGKRELERPERARRSRYRESRNQGTVARLGGDMVDGGPGSGAVCGRAGTDQATGGLDSDPCRSETHDGEGSSPAIDCSSRFHSLTL